MLVTNRRQFLRAGALGVAGVLVARRALAQGPASAGPVDPKLLEDLVAANRILADQGVVDGYGHVSVRHPADPQRYLMSRSIAPELVTVADIMEYDLDSTAVDARGRPSYLERFIHGEIYRVRPDVLAIVHNHSPSVIPFGVSTAPLRPLYHMSAFLGGGVPVFDIRKASAQPTDMLVRDAALGRALAQTLGARPVALMRGHGVRRRRHLAAGRRVSQRVHGDERAPAGAGDGAGPGDLSGRRGGPARRGLGGRHHPAALGAVEEESDGPLSRRGARLVPGLHSFRS